MKRKILVIIVIFITVGFLLPTFRFKSCATEQTTTKEVKKEQKEVEVEDPIELAIMRVDEELDAISHLRETDTYGWYKKYRDIVCRNRDVLDAPLSVFDYYTGEEINLVCRAVETECYGQSFKSKVMIANVIFNRLESGKYGSTIEEVITTPNQFAYWRSSIPEDTIYAVMFGFEMADLTDGSLAFHSNEKTQTFGGMEYVTTDKYSKHHFYR